MKEVLSASLMEGMQRRISKNLLVDGQAAGSECGRWINQRPSIER